MMSVRRQLVWAVSLSLAGVSAALAANSAVVLRSEEIGFKVHLKGTTLTDMRPPGTHEDWLDTQGHFLCFDRWGPATAEEQARGIPFHGEARLMPWSLQEASNLSARFKTTLPATRFKLDRTIALAPTGGAFQLLNRITNPTDTRRSYNLVEHVTLGAPWQQPEVTFATNATHGLLQRRAAGLPDTPFVWPHVPIDDHTVDLRNHAMLDGPVVVALIFDDKAEWGWICLRNQKTSTLLGYVWRTADYPWLNIYSKTEAGKFARFAVEPGTTSVHAVMADLIDAPLRLGRSVVNWLEAGHERQIALWGFTAQTPPTAGAVSSISHDSKNMHVEFADGTAPMVLPLPSP